MRMRVHEGGEYERVREELVHVIVTSTTFRQ